MKCSLGHEWEPSANAAAPLVCPTCGRSPLANAAFRETADDQTLDLPAHANLSPSEVTQTMHFTPPPGPARQASVAPASSSTSEGHSDARAARFLASASTPFTIIRQHARGGLGVVNLARDVNIMREVALKQILPQHADNALLNRRFLYEAQITGQLEHPSIVPVYCLGQDDAGHPYYVMRFVKGRTLDEHIKDHHASPNPIVFRELLRCFIAVCQAVAYAHSRGIIHRDLKPANVMLGDYGETLVLDWGLAKDIKQGGTDPVMWTDNSHTPRPASATPGPNQASSQSQLSKHESASQIENRNSKMGGGENTSELTMQGQIIGTPAYMAPEQAEGRTEAHGPPTDIYALGGILFKILTGQSPTAPTSSGTGTTGQRKFTFAPSPPPSKVAKDVDPILELHCMRAMATDPTARFPQALELAQLIQRWLDEHPLTYKAATLTDKVVAVLRPVLIPLLLTMTAIIAVLLAFSLTRK